MTAVIGILENNKLWLAGDSYTGDSSSDIKSTCSSPKVYSVGPMIVGLCGSPRHEIIFEELLRKEVKKKTTVISHEWIKFKLPQLFRSKCKKNGAIILDEDKEETMGDSAFLIGFDNIFYYVDCNFSIWPTQNTIVGIGVASSYALGALTALNDTMSGASPEEKLLKALDISANLSHYVSKPYVIVSLPG
jgi:ATP-dependent protease HslVU (ClpYQ) peptidase subunit